MIRTTVYLDETDKQKLAALAARTGDSEAELIRRGVRMVVAGATSARPRIGYGRSGDGRSARDADDLLAETGFGEA
jgi:hypothetical protein